VVEGTFLVYADSVLRREGMQWEFCSDHGDTRGGVGVVISGPGYIAPAGLGGSKTVESGGGGGGGGSHSSGGAYTNSGTIGSRKLVASS
jgi:hypothetical protein